MTHLRRSLGGVILFALASHVAAQIPAAPVGSVSFVVSYRGSQIGREDVTVTETRDTWTISSTGRVNAPIDLVVHKFEVVYSKDWQARTLEIDATAQGQLLTRSSTFTQTSATTTSHTEKDATATQVTQPVSARTVVLPNHFFAAYEALAARLGTMAIGATLPVYVLPQGELTATVDRVTPKHILKPDGPLDMRQYDLTIKDPRGPIGVEIWVDDHNHMARVSIPSVSILVQRDDLTSVMLRVENLFHPGDEAVSIPALGFSLAGTLSKPAGASKTEPAPAVILVGSAGLSDRDEMASGIPIFAQMAGTLADAGFIVVRYDKRGLGQSGGRVESAGLEEYTDDVAAVRTWLRERKDVDVKRIAIVAYGEGGAVGLLEAARTSQIAALALIGVTGLTGKEVTLRQQDDLLAHMAGPADVKDQKRDVQTRLIDAVMTGKGWDAIPPGLRSSSDTPWFKSWLLFDPAMTMKRVSQPVFIGIGALDKQAFADSVDRLAAASIARKKPPTHTAQLVVAGINHLLVPATTGDVSEYDKLATRTVSPELLSALSNWLKDTLPGRKK